jgi:hypothetical protein
VRAGSQELIPELQNENAMHKKRKFFVIDPPDDRKFKMRNRGLIL